MARTFDVIVIGVGAMGAAACYYLARRGVRVLGLEQFDVPHGKGSSHGFSRMIRKSYYEHADYVPLLQRAYRLWEELEGASGRKILEKVGGVYLGPREGALVGGAVAAAELHGLPHEVMGVEELEKRWPQFVVPAPWTGFYEPDAGFLHPERAIATYAELAMRTGAAIHGQEAVRAWRKEGAGYVVSTDEEEYAAGRLIFCGGAWSGKLVGSFLGGAALRVTRQVMAWVWPRSPGLFELGKLPVWAVDAEALGAARGMGGAGKAGGIYYGFPMIGEAPGLKFAHHVPTAGAVDPDTVSRETGPADREAVGGILGQFLPEAVGPLLSLKVCLYTNSPDGHFIVDDLPGFEGVQVACGFSGHGFKFASVMGESLAEGAVGGRREGMGFLGLGRFGRSAKE